MATKIWLGNNPGNEGDYNTAANWNPSGVPTTNDSLIFDGIVGTSQSVISGLSQSGETMTYVNVRPSYAGSIGRSGDPLYFDTVTTLKMEGMGQEFWIKGGFVDATFKPQTSGPNACVVEYAGGASQTSVFASGVCRVASGSDMTNVSLIVGTESAGFGSSPQVVFDGWSNQPTLVIQTAGIIYSSGNIADFSKSGGTFIHITGTMTAARMHGGRYNHHAGTLTSMRLTRGLLDESQSVQARTITSVVAISPNARVDLRNGANIVPATLTKYLNPVVLNDDG